MHTVELLEEALAVARRLGYQIRHEWLDGAGGGCEFGGRRWIFVDLSLSVADQFEQVAHVLQNDHSLDREQLTSSLRKTLRAQKAA